MSKSDSKITALNKWLESNPGKTDRDWLLEVRCKDEPQRQDLKKLFDWVDESEKAGKHINLVIAPPEDYVDILDGVPAFIDYPEAKHRKVFFEFDFILTDLPYDLDAPESIYNHDRDRHVRDYLKWKAKELGVENTNFVGQVITELFHPAPYSYPHWKSFPERYPNID